MELTNTNYFSPEANTTYMSVSQFKSFRDCEAKAMAEIRGEYQRVPSKDLLMGSYVDAYFSDELDAFTGKHPELFNKRTGELKADYKRCDELVQRAERDELFMQYMDGSKQVVMTGELFGIQWKVKVDVLHDDKIVDLKLMRDMEPLYRDGERKTFIDAWGYDIQGFVYQQIVAQNTGKELPFYLAVITKETTPDIEVIHIPQYRLNSAGELVKYYAPKYAEIKAGKVEPVRCGKCDWCKDSKKLVKPLEYEDLIERL